MGKLKPGSASRETLEAGLGETLEAGLVFMVYD